jgi:hypothetical protein
MSRRFAGAILVASLSLACTPTTEPPSQCVPGAGFVYVDAPGGRGSVASIDVSGPCAASPAPDCVQIVPSCAGSACDCRFLFPVAPASFVGGATCHIRATSPSGQVFVRDVTLMAPPDPSCFEPSSPFVTIDFGDAGAGAADASNADDGDASDAAGGASDADDGGVSDGADGGATDPDAGDASDAADAGD